MSEENSIHSSTSVFNTLDARVIEAFENNGQTIIYEKNPVWFYVSPGFHFYHGQPVSLGDAYVARYGASYELTDKYGNEFDVPQECFIYPYQISDSKTVNLLEEYGYIYRNIRENWYYVRFQFDPGADKIVLSHKSGKKIIVIKHAKKNEILAVLGED